MKLSNIKYEDISLYHYTSIEALKSIVSNKTIRLTDYRFLNDKEELKYAINAIKKSLNTNPDDIDNKELQDLLLMLEKGVSFFLGDIRVLQDGTNLLSPIYAPNTNIYLFSMTSEHDCPYMWGNYGSGCCIKMDSNKFFNYLYQIRDKMMYRGLINPIRGYVSYGNLVETAYAILKYVKDVEGQSFSLNKYSLIIQLTALYKNERFINEHEYRIGFAIPEMWFDNDFMFDENKQELAKKIKIENDSKQQIELLDVPVKDIIKEITISPYQNSNIVDDIKNFIVDEFGFEIPIKFSSKSKDECEKSKKLFNNN